jgi:hypothetical protein
MGLGGALISPLIFGKFSRRFVIDTENNQLIQATDQYKNSGKNISTCLFIFPPLFPSDKTKIKKKI